MLTQKPQLPRVVFEAAVTWAGRSGKSQFWSLTRAPAKGAPRDASVRTDEWAFRFLGAASSADFCYRDHAQLEKMRQLGMKPEDEYKLSTMREHISKLAQARQGCGWSLACTRQVAESPLSLQRGFAASRERRLARASRRCRLPGARNRTADHHSPHSIR